jgi:hypothetical protein
MPTLKERYYTKLAKESNVAAEALAQNQYVVHANEATIAAVELANEVSAERAVGFVEWIID